MASAKKQSSGKTYFMVESSDAKKALREFRQIQINQNKKQRDEK